MSIRLKNIFLFVASCFTSLQLFAASTVTLDEVDTAKKLFVEKKIATLLVYGRSKLKKEKVGALSPNGLSLLLYSLSPGAQSLKISDIENILSSVGAVQPDDKILLEQSLILSPQFQSSEISDEQRFNIVSSFSKTFKENESSTSAWLCYFGTLRASPDTCHYALKKFPLNAVKPSQEVSTTYFYYVHIFLNLIGAMDRLKELDASLRSYFDARKDKFSAEDKIFLRILLTRGSRAAGESSKTIAEAESIWREVRDKNIVSMQEQALFNLFHVLYLNGKTDKMKAELNSPVVKKMESAGQSLKKSVNFHKLNYAFLTKDKAMITNILLEDSNLLRGALVDPRSVLDFPIITNHIIAYLYVKDVQGSERMFDLLLKFKEANRGYPLVGKFYDALLAYKKGDLVRFKAERDQLYQTFGQDHNFTFPLRYL